jgi:hypothetical protein
MTRTPVHNIRARFAGHGSLNDDPNYQVFHWLPCLWGDTPDKFDWWKENCRIGYDALTALKGIPRAAFAPEAIEHRLALRTAERNLIEGPWYFPLTELDERAVVRGRTLRAYVEDILNSMELVPKPDVDEILKRVPVYVFSNVAEALKEKKKQDGNERKIALLEPRKALFTAAKR